MGQAQIVILVGMDKLGHRAFFHTVRLWLDESLWTASKATNDSSWCTINIARQRLAQAIEDKLERGVLFGSFKVTLCIILGKNAKNVPGLLVIIFLSIKIRYGKQWMLIILIQNWHEPKFASHWTCQLNMGKKKM